MIDCKNLKKTYRTGLKRYSLIRALDGLSFSVAKGEAFGIIGPNGAGKSTVLKILLGFVRQNGGTALLAGQKSSRIKSREHVGYLPEHPCLYNHLTIKDHLDFAAKTAGYTKAESRNRIEEVIRAVKLTDVADLPVRNYSKGMKQRGSLAYALLLNPRILILDEPMSGLDPLGRQLVVDIIRKYHQAGNTILFCSHILTDVERICSRIGIMNRGKMLTETSPANLASQEIISSCPGGRSPLEHYFISSLQADTRQ